MTALLAAFILVLQPTAPPAKPMYRAHRAPDCAGWRAARTGRGATPVLEAAYNIWFHGYVTGFNAHGPDPTGDLLGHTTWARIGAFIDAYCARNPASVIAEALPSLIADLTKGHPTRARDPRRRDAVMSLQTTCREWTGLRDDKLLRMAYGGAARGYLTAYNRWAADLSGDVLGPGNDSLIDPWLDTWCGRHPSAHMLEAMGPFILHLRAERAAGRLAHGETKANERVLTITEEHR
jgi:hypothetical protein